MGKKELRKENEVVGRIILKVLRGKGKKPVGGALLVKSKEYGSCIRERISPGHSYDL